MNEDLITYLNQERLKLLEDRQRLSACSGAEDRASKRDSEPSDHEDNESVRTFNIEGEDKENSQHLHRLQMLEIAANAVETPRGSVGNPSTELRATKPCSEIAEASTASQRLNERNDEDSRLSKQEKNLVNRHESTKAGGGVAAAPKTARRRKKDDMEQWVSDTFYSYFPGYNDEYQKRQSHLRERQRQHQENFLKHQMLNTHPSEKRTTPNNLNNSSHQPKSSVGMARSSGSTTSHASNKTDLEIIVTNPDYVPPKSNAPARPGTTRHKLLQDLCHIELSNIVTGEGVTERNRKSAELQTVRKKDYQRELMLQIEEKRRSIELLREKERRQEEALTRRLQDQLKMIQLEEQLEKEKLRAEKLRLDSENNRLIRDNLVAKLEKDSRLLYANARKKTEINQVDTSAMKTLDNAVILPALDIASSNANARIANNGASNNNKVYQYFSNSARHEYRRGKPLPAEVEFDVKVPDNINKNIERECFHLSEKVCPMCDAPLKNYENCCLRCQRRLSLRIRTKPLKKRDRNDGSTEDAEQLPSVTGEGNDDGQAECESGVEEDQTFALVCTNCQRLYTLCPSCLARSDVCRACHQKRKICMNCRRTLCSYCLEEIATGRDTECNHINETHDQDAHKTSGMTSARSFEVLEDSFLTNRDSHEGETSESHAVYLKTIHNDLETKSNRPVYSINKEFNAADRPDYAASGRKELIWDKPLARDFSLNSTQESDDFNIEHIRKETDKRLSRYLKNYGDLATQTTQYNRSTQTTPESSGRRDVVLHEEHNLSMPLLREMPKMTRGESRRFVEKLSNNQRNIENLKRRWEIPAVQKYSVSPTSPKVLTQVGAIRKQLQTERLLGSDY